ncbi:unnamed protein product [Arctia plantaginis]|uniref:Uncharacterized protein n=1 Tax=Arctia plantaginis TaxID=874455 RepID=A0A8S1B7U3_ARCPL|nr:unnamed protein product [Arctia plantaginis]
MSEFVMDNATYDSRGCGKAPKLVWGKSEQNKLMDFTHCLIEVQIHKFYLGYEIGYGENRCVALQARSVSASATIEIMESTKKQ